MSTFHGLEMAKQALFTQQMGLYTTGHNLSNVNTEGFSRQRVNFEAMSPFPSASRNRPSIPGQLGTGVMAGTVQRIRDAFLDSQYRTQNSKTAYWDTRATSLNRMENLLNEIDETGLSKTMNDFMTALDALSTRPDNTGGREVAIQKGSIVAESFNHIANSLEQIQLDLKKQIGSLNAETGEYDGKIGDVNSLLRQINDLNKQIGEVEPLGYLPNDLYDRRDKLIDELSGIVNIKVDYETSGKGSLAIADGIAKITLADVKGNPITDSGGAPIALLKATDRSLADPEKELGKLTVSYNDVGAVTSIEFVKQGESSQKIEDMMAVDGSLKALIKSNGYVVGENGVDKVVGDFPETLSKLNKLAQNFALAFNKIHKEAKDANGENGMAFFTNGSKYDPANPNALETNITAFNISINQELSEHPDKLAISADGSAGDGQKALELAKMFSKALTAEDIGGAAGDPEPFGKGISVTGYFQQIISKMAVDTQEANRRLVNDGVLQQKIQNDRLSVSAVSIDEEMTNLLKFQHAYNASARSMTAMDEILDKIINSMGLVGR